MYFCSTSKGTLLGLVIQHRSACSPRVYHPYPHHHLDFSSSITNLITFSFLLLKHFCIYSIPCCRPVLSQCSLCHIDSSVCLANALSLQDQFHRQGSSPLIQTPIALHQILYSIVPISVGNQHSTGYSRKTNT